MASSVARVYLNDVEVGSLPSSQYEAIVKDARQDKRLYLRQALNVIATVLRFFINAYRYIPHAWFNLLVIVVIADSLWPGLGSDFMAALMKMTKTEPKASLDVFRIALFWGFAFTSFSMLLGMASGSLTFGAVNEFDCAINRRIRAILEVPAEGQMTVVVEKNDENRC